MRSVVYAGIDPDLSSRLRLCEWPHLQTLTLHLSAHDRTLIANAVKLLDDANSTTCKDVTIQFDSELSFSQMIRYLLDPHNTGTRDLEHVVLRFSRVNIIWTVQPLRATRNSFSLQAPHRVLSRWTLARLGVLFRQRFLGLGYAQRYAAHGRPARISRS